MEADCVKLFKIKKGFCKRSLREILRRKVKIVSQYLSFHTKVENQTSLATAPKSKKDSIEPPFKCIDAFGYILISANRFKTTVFESSR